MTARTTKTAASTKPTAEQIAQAKKDVAAQRKLRGGNCEQSEAEFMKATFSKAGQIAEDMLKPKAKAEAEEDHASMFSSLNFDFRSFCESLGIAIPSKRRILVATVASIIVGGCIGYFGGQLLGMLVAGALVLTGSAFLSMLVYILGLCLLAYAAFVAGRKVAQYILTSNVDSDLSAVRNTLGSAKDRVFGWFKSEPKAVAAPTAAA